MSVVISRSDVGEFRKRYKWMSLFVLAAFGAVLLRLTYLQVVRGDEFAAMAHENIIRRVTVETTRGTIRDTNGETLASSRTAYSVYIVPKLVLPSVWLSKVPPRKRSKREYRDTLPKIAEILRLTPDERAALEKDVREACAAYDLTNDKSSPCTRSILVREDVSRDIVAELEQHRSDVKGANVVEAPVRFYPYKNLGSHLLGYIAELDAEALAKFRPEGYESLTPDERERLNPLAYGRRDFWGATGLERAWESHLRGRRGWKKQVVDAWGTYRNGPLAEHLLDQPVSQEPIVGRSLRLSIDIKLTQSIEKAMAPHRSGAVVVVETQTGRILALYSKPNFDPNELLRSSGRARAREAFTRLNDDPYRPMLDKTLSGAYPPGSTFKPFSALAALHTRSIKPDELRRCDGSLAFGREIKRCTHVHGAVNLRQAIAQSCNVYFFRVGEATGLDPIARVASAFGLGQRTGFSINPEAAGRMPTRAWYTLRYHANYFRKGFTINAAIGQGDVTVTPLQLTLAYAAIANGGRLYEPQVVRAIETSEGTPVQEFEPRLRNTIAIAPDHLRRIHDAMRDVLNDDEGTANPVRDATLDVAGKTGTAQPGHHPNPSEEPKIQWFRSRNHAWFAAFYPSRAPEITVVVLVEHGESGPQHAAPVAMHVIRDYQRLKAAKKTGTPP